MKLKSSAFNRNKQLVENVYLEKTHAGDFNLNDKDGFGLVYGKVIRLGFEQGKRSSLYVEYQHAKSGDVLYAEIELETLEVKNVQQKDIPVVLSEIQNFY